MRLFAFLAATLLFVGFYILGSTTEIDTRDAKLFSDEFDKLVEGIGSAEIFIHNMLIAAGMFIPGVGILWSVFSAWSTGFAFAALSLTLDLADIPAIAILFTPFGALELAAYSLATSRGVIFTIMLVRRRPIIPQIRILAIEAGIAAALLVIAAVIEIAAIEAINDVPAMVVESNSALLTQRL